MSFVKKLNLYTLLGLLLASAGLTLKSAHAAPGVMADYPLFLANSAQPNIFFLLDDSGSMHTELMTPEDYPTWGGIMLINGSPFMYTYGLGGATGFGPPALTHVPSNTLVSPTDEFYKIRNSNGTYNGINEDYALPTQAWMDASGAALSSSQQGVWRSRAYQYNKQYYNPHITYAPWAGVNAAGVAYADITTPAKTPFNPYYFDSTNSESYVDLTIDWTWNPNETRLGLSYTALDTYNPAFFNAWDDTNGDGIVDPTDGYHTVEILSDNSNQCTATELLDANPYYTYTCHPRPYTEEIKNFANWFAYHRKREYAAKYALSQVISNETNVRMGLMSIHQRNTDNSTEAANERIALDTMNAQTDSGAKKALLDVLFGSITNGGTPLVDAYTKTGDYFTCANNVFGNGNSAASCALDKFNSPDPDPAVCQQNFAVIVSDGDYSPVTFSPSDESDSDGSGPFDGDPYEFATTNFADLAMALYENDALDTGNSLADNVPTSCGIDENNAQHLVTYAVGFGIKGNLDPDNDLPAHPGLGLNGCPTVPAPPAVPAAFNWDPATITGAPQRIDDLIHATFNGRGNYFQADDPSQLTTSLTGAFQNIANRTASSASAAFNAAVISSTTQIYLTQFNSGSWTGDLLAYQLNADGSLGSLVWDAASLLDARLSGSSTAYAERAVVTFDPTPGTYAGIPFEWNSLTAAQQLDLKQNVSSTEVDTGTTPHFPFSEARVNYIRGDQSCEIGKTGCSVSGVTNTFRSRVSVLGDLINSTPVYVGRPSGDYPNDLPFGTGTEAYSSFKFGQTGSNGAFDSGKFATTRTPMVYVGGNDGMLHAFIAEDPLSLGQEGQELWAFIPNSVFSDANDKGLHELTEAGYEHQYYVDLTPTVIDVYADIDGDADKDWHTILVGGLRGGGSGLFAIDVTDPDWIRSGASASERQARAASKVMWEFSAADDPDLGYTHSEPAVVPLGTSSGVEWYVVVGNGYESTHADNNTGVHAGDDGNPYAAKLFLLKLEGPGSDGVWDIGSDYYKMDTASPAGTSVAAAARNGLSTPALADNDGDGIFDRAYAGDVLGHMWAFDLAGDPAPSGNEGWTFAYASGGNPAPLFTATDGDGGAGNPQPITMRPALGRHPSVATVETGGSANLPNIMVYFGTGQYLTTGDLTNNNTQTFYAVWDRGDDSLTVNRTTPSASNNNLQKQTLVETSIATGTGTVNVRYVDPDTNGDGTVDTLDDIDYTTQPMHGWYIDFPTSGERSIFNPLLRGGLVFFNTLIPSGDPCGFGGSGWIMAVNQNDGKSPNEPILDADRNGSIGVGDTINNVAIIGTEVTGGLPGGGALISAGGGGGGGPTPPSCDPPRRPHVEVVLDSGGNPYNLNLCLPEGAKVGRYSWRELDFGQ